MKYWCTHCGWEGDDPQETRSIEDRPVGYSGSGAGGAGGGGPSPGFVVMEKKHVSKNYCPECHKPLPKSQQPKIGMTSGQFEQSLGRVILFLVLAFAAYYIFI
jgi:hypothetical protein|tara:strand:+ start:279 stop:587 length:309 start_codon:yes stop_codon:yes gene_type:complete